MEPPARCKLHRGRRDNLSTVEDSVNVGSDLCAFRFTTASIGGGSSSRPQVAHARVPSGGRRPRAAGVAGDSTNSMPNRKRTYRGLIIMERQLCGTATLARGQ